MQQLIYNPDLQNKWDVFINLSADSIPVYTPEVLSQYYFNIGNVGKDDKDDKDGTVGHVGHVEPGPLHGLNFVTSSSCLTGLRPTNIDYFPEGWHKSGHYLQGGPFEFEIEVPVPSTDNNDYDTNNDNNNNNVKTKTIELKIHFGSQWMALTPQFVEYIATSMKDPKSLPFRFRGELIRRKKLMSDETFIPTLLANHETFQKTMPRVLDSGELESKSERGFFAIR